MKFLQQHPGIKHLLRLTASTWVVSVTIIAVLTGLGLVIGAIAIAVTLGDNGIQHIYDALC